ncbi:MAG: hypothetical protein ACOH2I_13135 [Pseudomonas sp.]
MAELCGEALSDGAAIYHQAARHIPLAQRQLDLSKSALQHLGPRSRVPRQRSLATG